MKYISTLAAIAAFILSTTAASGLERCPDNESLFDLRSVRLFSDNIETNSIAAKKEICVMIEGNLKIDLPQTSTRIEFTVERPNIKPAVWGLDIYYSIKSTPETSPLPITRGGGRVMRPCFYFPPEIATANSGELISLRVKVTTKDNDREFVRVSCVEGTVRIA
ncbi:hypothetical protein BGX26_012425 [Mortierella sp. AD094]|nr:hypothetical protein BGX26_012425 [Mortierella sp. AD094]